jgi:hypothetical protein
MALRHLILLILSLALAVVGCFFFGIVVAIYVGLLLHDEKMYYAHGLSARLFGATGAAVGVLLAWVICRLGVATLARSSTRKSAEPVNGLRCQ